MVERVKFQKLSSQVKLYIIIITIILLSIKFTNEMAFVNFTNLQLIIIITRKAEAAGRDLRLVINKLNAEAVGRGINLRLQTISSW